jgi:hypothetical protein
MRKWLKTHEGGLSQDFLSYLSSIAENVEIDSSQADVIATSYLGEPNR